MKEIEIYKRLVIANIIFFILSFIFLEYSKVFRLSFDKHWIYSSGHNWWIMVALPSAFWDLVHSGLRCTLLGFDNI